MSKIIVATACAVGYVLCAIQPAIAQVSELRAGVSVHDIRVLDNIDPIEKSIAINGEIIFEEPDFLKWALSPQPYIAGNLNLGGGTSYGGTGLLWRQNFGERFYGDFAFGLVVHDGKRDVEFADFVNDSLVTLADFDAAFAEFDFQRRNNVEYGSRILFREQLTLGYRLDDKWAMEGFFEHISHGKILSDGPNEGSDAAGIRLNRRF